MAEWERLEELRDRVNWIREKHLQVSAQQLAQWLSDAGFPTTDASVSRYESGARTKIPAEYVAGLARVAEISPRWILTNEGTPWDVEDSDLRQAVDVVQRTMEWLRERSTSPDEAEAGRRKAQELVDLRGRTEAAEKRRQGAERNTDDLEDGKGG